MSVVMTPVEEILNSVMSSCDFGHVDGYQTEGLTMDEARTLFWQDVIASKSSDSGFIDLVNSYLEHGWVDDSAVGWDDDCCDITEGHHRLVLAILLDLDEVPTTTWGCGGLVKGQRISAHHRVGEPTPFLV